MKLGFKKCVDIMIGMLGKIKGIFGGILNNENIDNLEKLLKCINVCICMNMM